MTLGSLAFQATSPSADEGYVLVLSPPDAEGRVAYREFTARAQPRDGVADAAEVAARVERWAKAGWSFSEHPANIRRWLRPG